MADVGLQGRLADFTLEEILQLIALQQKTGLLTVDASYPMVLAFESGMMVGYRDTRRSGIDPLESYLKRYGFFPRESWEHIDFVARNSNLDLTEILVNEGLISPEELAHLQLEAAQEDIFRGMQLRNGRYNFLPGRDGMAGLKGRVRIKVDGLLMEAVRRIDELESLRSRYPSLDLKVKLAEEEPQVSERSPAERRLLALIDERCTIGRIVAQARMSEFETLSTLDQLSEDGWIKIQAAPVLQADASLRPARGRKARKGSLVAPLALALTSLFMAAAIAWWAPWSNYHRVFAEGSPSVSRVQIERDLARLEAAVQVYRLDQRRYPSALEQLVARGWLRASELERMQHWIEYRVGKGGASYLIAQREDDISSPSR